MSRLVALLLIVSCLLPAQDVIRVHRKFAAGGGATPTAPTLTQSAQCATGDGSTGGTTWVCSLTGVASGATLYVAINGSAFEEFTGCTDDVDGAFTQRKDNFGVTVQHGMYVLANVTAGSHTVTCNVASAAFRVNAGSLMEWDHVNLTTPSDGTVPAHTSGSGAGDHSSNDITSTYSHTVIIGLFRVGNGCVAVSAASGFTSVGCVNTLNGSGGTAVFYKTLTSTATDHATATYSSGNWEASVDLLRGRDE